MAKQWQKYRTTGLVVIVIILLLPGLTSGTEEYIVPALVRVEAGSFQMGEEVGDLWDGCRPVHTVTLTYDFLIGKYEVTFAEYDAYCCSTEELLAHDQGWGRGAQPAINVTWRDAIAYCNWLSEREGLSPAYNREGELLDYLGNITTDLTKVAGYRLPIEAEWEYAASGGHKALPLPPRFLFAGSDDIDEVAGYFDNSGEEFIFTAGSVQAVPSSP